MDSNPLAKVDAVDTDGKLRRQRRGLSESQVIGLLKAVPHRHGIAYRITIATGLRRDEFKQLQWGDLWIDGPTPTIQLRAETTKSKRGDTLPLRVDLADLLRRERGTAGDTDKVCQVPHTRHHLRYLAAAGIEYVDDAGRRADFDAVRHHARQGGH